MNLPNNAGFVINNAAPCSGGNWIVNDTFVPTNQNDLYTITVYFTARFVDASSTANIKTYIDDGGSNPLIVQNYVLRRTDVDFQDFQRPGILFSGANLTANGGAFKMYSDRDLEVYDIRYVIEQTFNAQSNIEPRLDTLDDLTFEWMAQDTTLRTTVLNTLWQTQLDESTPILSPGTYEISWGYGWSIDITTSDFFGRLTVNDEVRGSSGDAQHGEETKDSAGGGLLGTLTGTGTNQRRSYNNSFKITITQPQSLNLKIQWRPQNTGVEANIWDAKIHVQKVSL